MRARPHARARLPPMPTWSHLSHRYHIREEDTLNAIKRHSKGYVAIFAVVTVNRLVVFVCSLACNSSLLPLRPSDCISKLPLHSETLFTS